MMSPRANPPAAVRAESAAHVGPEEVRSAGAAAAALRATPGLDPDFNRDGREVALELGSSLGRLGDAIVGAVAVPFGGFPGTQASIATGHARRFVLGRLEGRRGVAMQGRLHAHERYPASTCAYPVWM